MPEIIELLKVYKDFGTAALFIALLLITVYFFYKELKASKQEVVAMTEKMTTVADKSAAAIVDINKTCGELKESLDEVRTQNNEFVSFLKGRDDGHRRTSK